MSILNKKPEALSTAAPAADKAPEKTKTVKAPTPVKADPEQKPAKKKAPAVKKPAAKKAAAPKKVALYVEYHGRQVTQEAILAAVQADWTGGAIKTLEVYVKPEDGAVYYVVNGKETGRVDF